MDAEIDDMAGNRATPAMRRTRGALNDLSRQLAGVSVTFLATPNTNNHLPSSMMTPSQSPDEMIIQLRGRKNPVTWSPLSINGVQKLAQYEITPPKDATPTRTMLGLRSSPRKRLQLTDTKEISTNTSPEKSKRALPSSGKRQKLDGGNNPVSLDVALKGLSRAQLIELIQNLATKHSGVKQELESFLPEPDLEPVIKELSYLKKNILKSLPCCRLSSKSDAAAYSKAAVHLAAFKKYVMEVGKELVESEHWNSVIEFTLIAWDCVKATPTWDNVQHNVTRKQCFKALAAGCMKALKSSDWSSEWRTQFKQKLERLRSDSEDINECIDFLHTLSDKQDS